MLTILYSGKRNFTCTHDYLRHRHRARLHLQMYNGHGFLVYLKNVILVKLLAISLVKVTQLRYTG